RTIKNYRQTANYCPLSQAERGQRIGRAAIAPCARSAGGSSFLGITQESSLSEGFEDWDVPPEGGPQATDYGFDLDRTLSSVVALSARVAADAFTAQILGTERAGNGVLIREDGLVLTIAYLITEAEDVTLTSNAGVSVPGHVLDYDQSTGFGLVQALGELGV